MSAPGAVSVTLPRGLWRDGRHLRRAELRPVTGSDEETLAAGADLPAARVSRLLGRCLTALEGEPVEDGEELARSLAVGDREALLLHLRRLAFEDAMDCVLTCPLPECGERMDLTLRVTDLLVPVHDAPLPVHEVALEAEGEVWTVTFRPPTGSDQEEAAACLLAEGPEAAAGRLAERCVERVVGQDGEVTEELPPGVVEGLSAALAEADPQAELVLRLACPACRGAFTSRFDPGGYLLAELAAGDGRLYREVHTLALHYHWSEAAILALTPAKRRLYLGLLVGDPAGAAASEAAA